MLQKLPLLLLIIYRFQSGNALSGRYHRRAKQLMARLFRELALDEKLARERLVLKARWYAVQFMWLQDECAYAYQAKPLETDTAAYIGFLLGLSDYLIDDQAWGEQPLEEIIFPKQPFDDSWLGRLYFATYQQFEYSLSGRKAKEQISQQYQDTFLAQIRSGAQLRHDISGEEIIRLTADKCGRSLHLGLALAGLWPESALPAWYELGAFIQFCNDVQDLRKDLLGGLRNYATEKASFYGMGKGLIDQYNTCSRLIEAMAISQARKRYLSYQYYLYLIGTIAKLHTFQKLAGPYAPERMMALTKEQVRIRPTSPVTAFFILKYGHRWAYPHQAEGSLLQNLSRKKTLLP